MSRLSDIEEAIEGLAPAEKQQLLVFLAARLRANCDPLPAPRKFPSEQLKEWLNEDEADMLRLRSRAHGDETGDT